MQSFVLSKIISLSIPVGLILLGFFYWLADPTQHWWLLLVVLVFIGHLHSLIGAIYQLRSFKRTQHPKKHISIFLTLTVASVAFCVPFIIYDQIIFLMLFVILYFNFHGFLNERTLLQMQAGISLPIFYFVALAFLASAFIYNAMSHPSFFFTGNMKFIELSEETRLSLLEYPYLTDVTTMAYIFFVVGTIFFFLSLWKAREYKTFAMVNTALWAVATFLFTTGQMNFMFLFHLLLGYHFIVWSVVYAQKCWNDKSKFGELLGLHVLVSAFLAVTLACYLVLNDGVVKTISESIFDTRALLVVSFVHISVSLMNEAWFKRLLS